MASFYLEKINKFIRSSIEIGRNSNPFPAFSNFSEHCLIIFFKSMFREVSWFHSWNANKFHMSNRFVFPWKAKRA